MRNHNKKELKFWVIATIFSVVVVIGLLIYVACVVGGYTQGV